VKFYITLAGALFFIGTAILGIFKPDLVWGRPPVPITTEYQKKLLRRKRLVGTVVFLAIGVIFLILALSQR